MPRIRNKYPVTFDHLPPRLQRAVLDKHVSWNLEYYDWWADIYTDAKAVGMRIKSFDCHDHRIDLFMADDMAEICTRIIANHGESCDTHEIAKRYLAEIQVEEATFRCFQEGELMPCFDCSGNGADDNGRCWACSGTGKVERDRFYFPSERLTRDFKREIGKCYLKMLSDDYDYRTSDEAIRESFLANEIQFDCEGRIA